MSDDWSALYTMTRPNHRWRDIAEAISDARGHISITQSTDRAKQVADLLASFGYEIDEMLRLSAVSSPTPPHP